MMADEDELMVTELDLTIYPPDASGEIIPYVMIAGPSRNLTVLISLGMNEDDTGHVTIKAGNIPAESDFQSRERLMEFLTMTVELIKESMSTAAEVIEG